MHLKKKYNYTFSKVIIVILYMAHISTRKTVNSKEWRLKTDEEIEEMPVRPWICGCGDEIDDNTPRRCEWLYWPWCRNSHVAKVKNTNIEEASDRV